MLTLVDKSTNVGEWQGSLRVEPVTAKSTHFVAITGKPTHQPPPRCVGFLFKLVVWEKAAEWDFYVPPIA
jgi:hypothetical protein